jgi:hypothetical protein
MNDAQGSHADDFETLLDQVQGRLEALGGDPGPVRDWRARVAEQQRADQETRTKIIRAVGELLAAFPGPAGGDDRQKAPATGREAHRYLTELTGAPSSETQLVSLLMLAAVTRLLSHESGRSEAAILDELAASS